MSKTKVAIITGASRGLGLALSFLLLNDGYKVYGISKTKKYWKEAKRTVKNNPSLFLEKVNISSEKEVKKYVQKISSKNNTINILINNAGYGIGLN